MRTLVFATTILLAMAATASAEEDCQLKRYGVVAYETDSNCARLHSRNDRRSLHAPDAGHGRLLERHAPRPG